MAGDGIDEGLSHQLSTLVNKLQLNRREAPIWHLLGKWLQLVWPNNALGSFSTYSSSLFKLVMLSTQCSASMYPRIFSISELL